MATNKVGRIAFAQPDYGLGHPQSHKAFWVGGIRADSPYRGRIYQVQYYSSFNSGNIFLASSLNEQEAGQPLTHLAMMHNDVVPLVAGYLDMLMEDLLTYGADMMSAVIPIKDPNAGVSSTAIDSGDPFKVERRLTMKEIHSLPEVFDNRHCGYPNNYILANTGLFVLDFTKPWRYNLTFTSPDRIRRGEDGRWMAEHAPSDWNFSRDIQKFGGKVMCSRRIPIAHMGECPFSNETPWGDWDVDEALKSQFGDRRIGPDCVVNAPVVHRAIA